MSGTILIIEDDKRWQDVLRTTIGEALPGYNIEIAGSMFEGTQRAQQLPSPVAVVFDNVLPRSLEDTTPGEWARSIGTALRRIEALKTIPMATFSANISALDATSLDKLGIPVVPEKNAGDVTGVNRIATLLKERLPAGVDVSLVERGKRILQAMMPLAHTSGNFGYPKFSPVPSATRAESDKEYTAVNAFLQNAGFKNDVDYQWSYYNGGEQAVLNFKIAPYQRLQTLIQSQQPQMQAGER